MHSKDLHQEIDFGHESVDMTGPQSATGKEDFKKTPAGMQVDKMLLDRDNERPAITSLFLQFGELPAELRIKIWEYMFIPRVVGLDLHSSRPFNICSTEALLMDNHEAHQIFVGGYSRSFQNYGPNSI